MIAPPIGIEKLIEILKTGAANMTSTLASDGDWATIALFTTDEGRVEQALIMPGGLYDLPAVLVERRATSVAVIDVAWQVYRSSVEVEAIEAGIAPRARDAIDRVEILSIIAIDANGLVWTSSAPITRRPGQPPEIGDWEDHTSTAVEGTAGTALQEAMTYVRTH